MINKETPIILPPPDVNLVLGNHKTHICKPLSPRPTGMLEWFRNKSHAICSSSNTAFKQSALPYCPYGLMGDNLWVKETWTLGDGNGCDHAQIYYKSDDSDRRISVPRDIARKHIEKLHWLEVYGKRNSNWQSPILMQRWASRIMLEITDVKVFQLKEIDFQSCLLEGIPQASAVPYGSYQKDTIESFMKYWDICHPKNISQSNPWVWGIKFKRIEMKQLRLEAI